MDSVNRSRIDPGQNSPMMTANRTDIPYLAMFDFFPGAAEELQIVDGDVVEVMDRNYMWWIAVCNG